MFKNAPIAPLLKSTQTIAIVGLSNKPYRDSYRVAQYMQRVGYLIIPVNPLLTTVLGQMAYASLKDIPGPIDLVNVFRRSEEVATLVDEAIAVHAKAIWLQLGIWDKNAVLKAQQAGLQVVANCCLMVEHAQLNTRHQ